MAGRKFNRELTDLESLFLGISTAAILRRSTVLNAELHQLRNVRLSHTHHGVRAAPVDLHSSVRLGNRATCEHNIVWGSLTALLVASASDMLEFIGGVGLLCQGHDSRIWIQRPERTPPGKPGFRFLRSLPIFSLRPALLSSVWQKSQRDPSNEAKPSSQFGPLRSRQRALPAHHRLPDSGLPPTDARPQAGK